VTRSPDRSGSRARRAAGPAGAPGPADPPAQVEPSQSALMGPAEIRGIARALGLRPTKMLGQNFVHDAGTVRRIVRAGDVRPGDEVLEVGPGLGSLTLALLEGGARVRAVEIDATLARALAATVTARMPEAADRLRVIHADAMRIRGCEDLGPWAAARREPVAEGVPAGRDGTAAEDPHADPWPPPTRLVANLPYNVAVPVLLSLLERLPSLTDVLIMVQAEVADRLAAGPGSRTYGVPSVKAAWYGTTDRVGTIGRSVFWPSPNVDSALVRLRRSARPRGDEEVRRATFEVVDVAFGQRRKTLRAAMRQWAGSAEVAEELLRAAGVDPGARGETLTIEEFAELGRQTLLRRRRGELPAAVTRGAAAPAATGPRASGEDLDA